MDLSLALLEGLGEYPTSVKAFFKELFAERFYLGRAERSARGISTEQRTRVRFIVRAARARALAAGGLRSPEEAGPAISLLREAVALAVTALLVFRGQHDAETPLSAGEAWQRLETETLPVERALLEPLMASTDTLAPDRLETRDALRLRAALEGLLAWLFRQVELRTVRRIWAVRVLRLSAVAALLVTLLVVSLVFALAPTNVAAGKPAHSSSRWPGSPDPRGLTDGVRGHGFGAHTQIEQDPWLEVDLGAPHAVRQVVVYHRSDGFERESLPLTLQLSEDHASWRDMGTRTALFTSAEPWVAACNGARGRYVRLTLHGKGYIALSEIEVFGKP